jgi:hypothetical protein
MWLVSVACEFVMIGGPVINSQWTGMKTGTDIDETKATG